MNSRQYAKQQEEACKTALQKAGLTPGDYAGVCLSADRTEYTVTLIDGSTVQVSSGFEHDPATAPHCLRSSPDHRWLIF